MLGLIGAAVSAIGTIASSQAQAAQAEYNAKVADINAQTARQAAAANAEKKTAEYDTLRGRQRGTLGAAGVRLAGSPDLVINQDTYSDQYLDTANIIWQGETQATGYENKATDLRQQAKGYKTGGAIGAVGSLVGGFKGLGQTLRIV